MYEQAIDAAKDASRLQKYGRKLDMKNAQVLYNVVT